MKINIPKYDSIVEKETAVKSILQSLNKTKESKLQNNMF
jgi:hypothetical protein